MNKYQEALYYFINWLNPIEEDFNQEIYRKHRNNLQELIDKEKVLTLEEVIKAWEVLGHEWSEYSRVIHLCRETSFKNETIIINKEDYSYYKLVNDILHPIDLREHQLLTKTFKALGRLEDDN